MANAFIFDSEIHIVDCPGGSVVRALRLKQRPCMWIKKAVGRGIESRPGLHQAFDLLEPKNQTLEQYSMVLMVHGKSLNSYYKWCMEQGSCYEGSQMQTDRNNSLSF
jgi:hypothetical protein